MSASTSVHSNAFNFSSYVESGVDPRTGQYTVAIKLPELKGNDLQGPDFELALFYSPLNTQNSGYGKGWNLQLSQVSKRNQVVTLSSGESYKITGEPAGPDAPLQMSEQKLRQFELYPEPPGPGGAERYRVVHRSGRVEVLQMMGSGLAEVALPIEMHSPLGHVLYLQYELFGAGYMRLGSVRDASDTLLTLVRQGSRVELLCYPYGGADGGPLARYAMTLSQADNRVSEIILPTANQARWSFTYREVRGVLCVSEVHTPYGGHETLRYEDVGHAFPVSAQRPNLPRVTYHETAPGFKQPATVVTYDYPGLQNFLGGGSTLVWDDGGLDNLYQVAKGYQYQSIETVMVGAKAARTITRTFNRFHLLTEQRTVQGDNVQQAITSYGDVDADFAQQPPQFQLPVLELTRWSLASDANRRREEKVESSYDNHGNLLTRLQANGVLETQVWYTAVEDGYPGDGSGFVRYLKSKTVTPAIGGQGAAPTLSQRYRYTALAPLGSYLETPWLAVESETLVDAGNGDALLEQTLNTYERSPEPWRYGRLQEQAVWYPGSTPDNPLGSVTLHSYSKPQGLGVLQVEQSLTGYAGEKVGQSKLITLQHDLQSGEPRLNHDDNDVEIRYEYDALRRVTRETVAPGTEYEAFRHYRYFLCAYDNEQAQQWAYDVKQVETHTLFDGLSRAVFEEREDTDSSTFAGASRPIYRALYDELGQLREETEVDWLGDQLLELTSQYQYDDWGAQYSVTGPDGVTHVEYTDHVASTAGPVQFSWRHREDHTGDDGQSIRLGGTTRTDLNLFEQPARIERLDLLGDRISLQVNVYDGLGRIYSETRGTGTSARVETFVHDAFDRQVEQQLADRNSRVYRTYAGHSRDDLPVSIRVGNTFANAKLLGEQTFDGLGRRTSATTGGRVQRFEYEDGMRQPQFFVAADGTRVQYTYTPALGEEPSYRLLAGTAANFTHDRQNARLTHCDEPGQAVDRTYFSQGDIKTETRTLEGEPKPFTMTYDHSYRSRLRGYVDVQGQAQLYDYDPQGRLAQTTLHAASGYGLRRTQAQAGLLLQADFSYDLLSRLQSTTTQDLESGRQLITSLEYDEFDRETLRTFDFGDTVQTLEQGYDQFDCLEYRTLKERPKGADEGDAELLRHEEYFYDPRGRLVRYTCEGPLAPVDPSGMVIARQDFGFDPLDNITTVMTRDPAGQSRLTRYEFRNQDPVQLSRIVSPPDPAIDLQYDLNGNLISDEQGRVLRYDGLNRLLSVDTPAGEHCSYQYDPENILSGTTQ
ncbi:RHS repeat domain-containing protein [Pseudomonas xanthosomatis]|uniref:RHS repeat domain-containing protein n=1 Tax=Pseudomonas xanthosomatis TaxID=2842356 RepID=UPI003515C231